MPPPSTASSLVFPAAEAGAAVAEAVLDAEPLTVVPTDVCEVTVTVLVLIGLLEAADAALVLMLLATELSTLNTLLR